MLKISQNPLRGFGRSRRKGVGGGGGRREGEGGGGWGDDAQQGLRKKYSKILGEKNRGGERKGERGTDIVSIILHLLVRTAN